MNNLRFFFLCMSKEYFDCISNLAELDWFISFFYCSFWQRRSRDFSARLECLLYSLEWNLNLPIHLFLLCFLFLYYFFWSIIDNCNNEIKVIQREGSLYLGYRGSRFLSGGRFQRWDLPFLQRVFFISRQWYFTFLLFNLCTFYLFAITFIV